MKVREAIGFVALFAMLLVVGPWGTVDGQSLTNAFYANSCANVDTIVRNTMLSAMNQSQIVGPSVLRLFAHDCFVGGCDASILLVDSSPLSDVEKDASDNLSLQQLAFDTINQVKAAVEAQCPGVVSCADILALAAQDAVSSMGGPSWPVPFGRRDGMNSSAVAVPGNLPASNMNYTQLSGIFTSIGLSSQDLVALSGAHTVGFAHCQEFVERLYDFNNVSGAVDPALNSNYAITLQGVCPQGNFSNSSVQALDPRSPTQFDNLYYQQLQTGQGLLFSDQVLYVTNQTSALVATYANNQAQFFSDFVTSMIALSQVNVLTGTSGEIRTNCSVLNGAPSAGSPTNSSTSPPTSPPSAPLPPASTPSSPPPPSFPPPPPPPPSPPPLSSPPPSPPPPSSPPPSPPPPSSPPPSSPPPSSPPRSSQPPSSPPRSSQPPSSPPPSSQPPSSPPPSSSPPSSPPPSSPPPSSRPPSSPPQSSQLPSSPLPSPPALASPPTVSTVVSPTPGAVSSPPTPVTLNPPLPPSAPISRGSTSPPPSTLPPSSPTPGSRRRRSR